MPKFNFLIGFSVDRLSAIELVRVAANSTVCFLFWMCVLRLRLNPLEIEIVSIEKFLMNYGIENLIGVHCKYSPLTVKLKNLLIFGSVLTWHSYRPVSFVLELIILRVQVSFSGFCITLILSSAVKVCGPLVIICKSLVRIHETWKRKRTFI